MAKYPAQLPSETSKAYAAFADYCGMGADRSFDKLRQSYSRPTSYIRQLATWSSLYTWQDRVKEYDGAVQEDIAAERTKRYLADLDDHRTRYQQAGRALYNVAAKMLHRLGKEVEDLELTPAALGILLRAFTTAADLEAHALNLDELMPRLQGDDDDRG